MNRFNLKDKKYKHVHFIGIGGINMSTLAELLINYGYHVSGSDAKLSQTTAHLEDLGAKVFHGHAADQVDGADLVVYTDAVSLDNPELKAAISKKIDVIDRASFLGLLMQNYEVAIGVSGTHGKTSTTSMITSVIKDLPIHPTILLGGNLNDIHGNILVGKEKLFLTEACEYRANILKYYPTTAVILNIDEDHLDFFENIEHIIDTFREYVQSLSEEDLVILNIDDPHVRTLADDTKSRVATVSIKEEADYQAKNIDLSQPDKMTYDLYVHGDYQGQVELQVLGLHNVSNSLSAIAACHENYIDIETCIRGLKHYRGVKRRQESKGIRNGIHVIDDYAHHPTEIASTLHALRPKAQNQLFCIFQPHTFTRTRLLLEKFSESFHEADHIIVTDIYAAREKDYGNIHSKTLVDAINKKGDDALYLASDEEVIDYLNTHAKEGDLILTMGAGDVYLIGEAYLDQKNI